MAIINKNTFNNNKNLMVKLTRLSEVNNRKTLYVKLRPLNRTVVRQTLAHCNIEGSEEKTQIIDFKHKNKIPIYRRMYKQNTFANKNLLVKLTRLSEVNKSKTLYVKLTPLNKNVVRQTLTHSNIEGSKEETVIDLKPKNIPIYRRMLPDTQKAKMPTEDLYAFTDYSPKIKKVGKSKRLHNSSILFDKHTYEIMKRLEEREAKEKNRLVKKKRLKKGKPYDKIVNKIVGDVLKNISKRKKCCDGTEKEALGNKRTIDQENKNLQGNVSANHNKIVHVNNFQKETNIVVSDVPYKLSNPELEHSNIVKNIATTKGEPVMQNNLKDDDPLSDNCDNLFNISDIDLDEDPIVPQSINSCDNSVSHKDIDTYFGFDDNILDPVVASTPAKSVNKHQINILNDIVLRPGVSDVQSPIDFHVRRPNANSTMVFQPSHRPSSPWRIERINIKHNPHFVSIKENALPRLQQEMVLDHTLVESFVSASTPMKKTDSALKKHPVQQSILDFVDSNTEKKNETLQGSLYDVEEFNSPVKKHNRRQCKNMSPEIKRNLIGDLTSSAATVVQRRPLMDISNSSGEVKDHNVTYFGFDRSTQGNYQQVLDNRPKPIQITSKEDKENDPAKPSRFNISKLKSYTRRRKNLKMQGDIDNEPFAIIDNPEKSVSIFEVSDDQNVGEIHLFEEPEEMLDTMSPVHINEKKYPKRRLNSCDSETSEHEKKRKRHRKTKLEIEQEAWIKDFNKMCEEVDNYELEVE